MPTGFYRPRWRLSVSVSTEWWFHVEAFERGEGWVGTAAVGIESTARPLVPVKMTAVQDRSFVDVLGDVAVTSVTPIFLCAG